jgi:hypothetical protein
VNVDATRRAVSPSGGIAILDSSVFSAARTAEAMSSASGDESVARSGRPQGCPAS